MVPSGYPSVVARVYMIKEEVVVVAAAVKEEEVGVGVVEFLVLFAVGASVCS